MQIDEKRELETSKPADFSFKKLKSLEATGPEQARASRLGGVPERGAQHKKFLTRSIWLNNNKVKSIRNLDAFVDSILEFPERLGWIDFSFNQISEIHESILKFTDLKIVYFHGNCIENLDQILKLKNLKSLKTVTFHGNPISNLTYYRNYIIAALPQIDTLDFTPVLKNEKMTPAPSEFLKDTRSRAVKEATKENSQIKDFFKDQTLFLTGGSGFLGKVLIEKLLRECEEIDKIYVLMRSKKNKSPEERFLDLFNYACFDRLKSKNVNVLQKVSLIDGDCQKPCLGLSDQDVDLLKKETTCVIHAAANVKFDQSLKEATYNVRASRDLLELAKEMPNLKAFVYVSTAYSNCLHLHIKEEFYEPPLKMENLLAVVNAVDDDVLQAITPTLLGKWPNTYIFTKCVSEDLMRTVGKNLPIAIVRPAIVFSTIAEPMPGWIDNLYGAIGIVLGAGLGVIRSLHAKWDAKAALVPVDYVANCVLSAAWERHKSGSTTKIYNYAGDKKNQQTWIQFMNLIEMHGWTMPTDKMLWYYNFKLRENKLWHDICIFFLHTIPAYLVDFVLACCARPTIAVKSYERINKMLDSIGYFSTKSWAFDDDNVMELWNEMNDEDKRRFSFSMEKVDWSSYYNDCMCGGRVYLLKDPLDTIPKGERKFRLLRVAHYAVMALLLYLLYKFVNFAVGLFL